MLKLDQIKKDYLSESDKVNALKGVSLEFRESEFVSILGPSGCGKTTLLNIIGGLDHYTSGDLVIDGKSTKDFRDSDWDTYRNHSIGFVFQSYNLIPHQSVLANVELALTLSGVSKAERRKKAAAALEKVGLKDQMKKRPNQLSGGQMQRVAIARALVNDPDILLADEPTGALDSVTSIQIMELLKEISKDKLIIMVTHNPTLAEEYSNRIIRLLDGEVVDDTNPYHSEAQKKEKKKAKSERKTTMSFMTALSLSLNNLMTKKGRTLLTAFAGSIGIIGIALILALSHGINAWIYDTQEETLSSSPISIQAESVDMTALMTSLMGINEQNAEDAHDLDAVYSSSVMSEMINTFLGVEVNRNNLTLFKEFLESNEEIKENITNIQYSYNLDMNIYTKDSNGNIVKSDVEDIMTHVFEGIGIPSSAIPDSSSTTMGSLSFGSIQLWQEMLPGEDGNGISPLLKEQYELINENGHWPEAYNEVVLIVNENNELSDLVLCGLGLIPKEKLIADLNATKNGEMLDTTTYSWSYDEICGKEFKIYLPTDLYRANGNGGYSNLADSDQGIEFLFNSDSGVTVKISGIVRLREDANTGMLSGAIGYSADLTKYLLEQTKNSAIIAEQMKNPDRDIITNLPFKPSNYEEPSAEEKADAIRKHLMGLSAEEKAEIYAKILAVPTDDEVKAQMAIFDRLTREELERLLLDALKKEAEKNPDSAFDPVTIADAIKQVDDETLREGLKSGIEEEIKATKLATVLARYSTSSLAAMFDARLSGADLSQLDTEAKSNLYLEHFVTPTQEEIDQQMAGFAAMSREELIAVLTQSSQGAGSAEDFALLSNEMILAQIHSGIAEQLRQGMIAAVRAQSTPEELAAAIDALLASLTESGVFPFEGFTQNELAGDLYDEYMPATHSENTLEQNLKLLGKVEEESPSAIHIYTDTFEKKDTIADLIEKYNETKSEEDKIEYTDILAFMMSSFATIINAISYVLVAFVSISLVVSSIMIGIITYISVLERTKEIGILRAIGASKKDISRVFNAESIIQGFAAGVIGIGITLILIIPINMIIHHLTGIPNLGAAMPLGGYLLIAVSVLLSFIAGLVPSRIAAKKDPVEALRSE